MFLHATEAERQTNLSALHGLEQVGQRVSEGADEDATELLEQSADTRDRRPETHRFYWFINLRILNLYSELSLKCKVFEKKLKRLFSHLCCVP